MIFAPQTAPPAKIAQLLIYGAQVILVDGNYDQAFDLTIQAAQNFGWYCRNTGYNPFTAEGKKTAAFEIWEQVLLTEPAEQTRWRCLSRSGMAISSRASIRASKTCRAWAGWSRCRACSASRPKAPAAVANAFLRKTEQIMRGDGQYPGRQHFGRPAAGWRARRARRTQTGGDCLVVSDSEILQAIAALGKAGIFAEPAGAAAYAGLVKALEQGLIGPDDPVLVLNTGSG